MMLIQSVLFFIFYYSQFSSILAQQNSFDTTDCGTSKGCIFRPVNCDPAVDCVKAFSYRIIDDNHIEMELFGVVESTTAVYVAVGFSQDDRMGGEMVVECSNFDQTNDTAFAARISYNLGKDDNNTQRNVRIANLNQTIASSMLQLISTRTSISANSNITLYCRVRQLITPMTTDVPELQSLNTTYHLLMAAGPTSSTGSFIGSVNVTLCQCIGLLRHYHGPHGDFRGPKRTLRADAYMDDTATTTATLTNRQSRIYSSMSLIISIVAIVRYFQ